MRFESLERRITHWWSEFIRTHFEIFNQSKSVVPLGFIIETDRPLDFLFSSIRVGVGVIVCGFFKTTERREEGGGMGC